MDPVSDGVLGAWAIAELEGGADFASVFRSFTSSSHFWREISSAVAEDAGIWNEISSTGRQWIDGMHEFMDGPGPAATERSMYEKFAAVDRATWGSIRRSISPYLQDAANLLGGIGAGEAIHHGVQGLEHMFGGHPTTPGNTQPPYNPTPTTPGQIPIPTPDNIIEMFGHNSNGHSLLPAQSMGFRDSDYGGALSGKSRFRSSYPANQTRRQTEQFGDLNGHNRIYQFYNYHGEKKQMLEEYARGLVLSMVRIQKGVIHDYDQPIAWPYPVHQPEADTSGAPKQGSSLDMYLNWIEFHFKDARRDGGFYGKTLGNRHGTEGYVGANSLAAPADEDVLAFQYRYDVQMDNAHSSCVQLWEADDLGNKTMKSLNKLSQDIADMFEKFAYLGADMTRAHLNADPTVASPHIDTLDIRPCRIMLIKSLAFLNTDAQLSRLTHDVVYDDEQFASSRVDIGSYTTVTLHNVSPASGDMGVQDPLSSDTITHVPLVGKMYTFSGSCPKVWDKHKADLHALFNPLFFRVGRYRLPASKLDDLKQFKTPPRGRAIWSNCIGESKIVIGPGMIKKLRMNFRIRESLGEFWQKYRDHYLSDSRLGRTVCICLEPMIRREHIGEPKPVVLKKEYEAARIDTTADPALNTAFNTGPAPFDTEVVPKLDTLVEYQPYELAVHDNGTGLVTTKKKLRPMFNFATAQPNQDFFILAKTTIAGGIVMAPQKAPAYPSQGIQYWWYDDGVYPNGPINGVGCIRGGIVHPTQLPIDTGITPPSYPNGEPIAMCLPGWGTVNAQGLWQLCMWNDDPARCSKGDPMMFNIQINRMLHASTRLKKFIALGADKTGIKRSWDDRLIANLGSNMFTGTAYDGEGPDAPRDVDMFNQAGIKNIVPEGDSGNLTIASAAPPASGGITQQQMTDAMTAALTVHRGSSDYHPLSGAVHTTGLHSGKLLLDHHPLAGVTVTNNKIGVITDALKAGDLNLDSNGKLLTVTEGHISVDVTHIDGATLASGAELPVSGATTVSGLGLSTAAQTAIAAGIAVTDPNNFTSATVDVADPDGLTTATVDVADPDGLTAATVDVADPDGLTAATVDVADPDGLTAATVDVADPDGLTAGTVTLSGPPSNKAHVGHIIDHQMAITASDYCFTIRTDDGQVLQNQRMLRRSYNGQPSAHAEFWSNGYTNESMRQNFYGIRVTRLEYGGDIWAQVQHTDKPFTYIL